MKPHLKLPCTILAAALQLTSHAAVPVAWTNSPGMPPYPIKPLPHGSTVDLAVTLKGYTTPPIADGADVRLWYQTNGMGQAWWSAPATFDGSTITSTFGPAQDCGADRVSLFFGAPSNVFASAVLRLTHAPGFTPSSLPLPVPAIDFAAVELRNLSALTNGWSFGSTPGDYETVSNRAMRISLPGDDGHPGGVFRPYFNGQAKAATDASNLTKPGQSPYPGKLTLNQRYQEDGEGALTGVWWPAFLDAWNAWHWVASEDYVDEAINNIGIASEESDPVWSEEKSKYAKHEDVPEWPVQLITTNTPLIFADGQDTNVTSIALQAQPTNYTSLSFLHPVSYYLPNRFSLLELGNDYQIVGSQWFQVGRYLYAQNPENIVFVGSGRHRSLQDYLDACAPETLADLLSCYVPTNGGGRIHGDLEIDGRLTAGELITITNSDIHAKGFQVVNKVLTADGLTASNGMVRLNCARFVLGFGTPRIHLETNTLSAITYGGTWEHPVGTMQGMLQSACQDLLAGNISYQSIEDRDPYVRYNDVKKTFFDWDLKSLPVNAGPLKHFDLQTGKTHYFTDADVGREGIELRIYTNTHVRVVYDFETAPPSSVYVRCNDSADERATVLSNGSELLYPTAGQRTLFEIEPLSNGTFIVKETALTFMDNVGSWEEANHGAQEEEP